MLESKVFQYEIGYTEILLVRCGLGWSSSNFKGGTNNGGRSLPLDISSKPHLFHLEQLGCFVFL